MNIVLIIIILIIIIGLFLYFLYKIMKKEILSYINSNEHERDKMKALLLIFITPIIIFILDYNNFFSKIFSKSYNLSEKYDWLSFSGSYIGAVVGALFLLFITEKDRDENTNVIREAQRPYLDVRYMIIDNEFFKKSEDKIIILNHGKESDVQKAKKKYLTLCIKNNGASVAIIDINRTTITLQYLVRDDLNNYTFQLNSVLNRMSIKSGEEIYIKFCNNYLYTTKGNLKENSKIIKSKIYYKDLFNKHYLDECELNTTLEVINDNIELNIKDNT